MCASILYWRMFSLYTEYYFLVILPSFSPIYTQVRHGSSLINPKEDDWCWDRSVINLDVGIEDIKGAVFMQKGYWIDVISTHNTDAYIRGPDSSRVDLLIKVVLLMSKFCN